MRYTPEGFPDIKIEGEGGGWNVSQDGQTTLYFSTRWEVEAYLKGLSKAIPTMCAFCHKSLMRENP